MENIKRYSQGHSDSFYAVDDGEFVSYEDHLVLVTELKRDLLEAQEELGSLEDYYNP